MLTEVGLRGAVVIVTGAGSGIGAATARQLGTVGARVVLVGRREALLTDVAAEIAEAGGDALSVTADLADQASPLASFMTGAVIPLDGGQVIDRE